MKGYQITQEGMDLLWRTTKPGEPAPGCACFYCQAGEDHPQTQSHSRFGRITDHLLVAESLDPADRVKIEACDLCGHIRVAS